MNKKVVISSGDPAGCGPVITVRAIQSLKSRSTKFIVCGDTAVFSRIAGFKSVMSRCEFIDAGTRGIAKLKPGKISRLAGGASKTYLDQALTIAKSQKLPLVTAPVSKEAIGLVNPGFTGHTEYLAHYFKTKHVDMLMWSQNLKVVLLTRHLKLSQVSGAIKKAEIIKTLKLTNLFLKQTAKIKTPKIAFTSINPHAGVGTFLAKEEKIVQAAIVEAKIKAQGPYPADTVFIPQVRKQFDCIIAAYHDQAMIPFKLEALESGVNVTLGLPVIRTSPAHGVAFDAIKSNKPLIHSSMTEAIRLACRW
jgi:4-hydroxythreonine-4-phosphate dehydrogenase